MIIDLMADELAKEYGVSHGNIYAILNKRIWKHLWA